MPSMALSTLPIGRVFAEIRATRYLSDDDITTLQRLEHDERMRAVWGAFASRKLGCSDIKALVVATMQAKLLTEESGRLDQIASYLTHAAAMAKDLDEFLEKSLRMEQKGCSVGEQDQSTIERILGCQANLQWIEAYIAARQQRYSAATPVVRPTSQKNAQEAQFSVQLSRLMIHEFGQPLDEIVSVITSVTLNTPESVDPDAVRKRRERDAQRRIGDRTIPP